MLLKEVHFWIFRNQKSYQPNVLIIYAWFYLGKGGKYTTSFYTFDSFLFCHLSVYPFICVVTDYWAPKERKENINFNKTF